MRNIILVRNFVIFFVLLGVCVGSLGYYIYRTNKSLDLSDNWVFHSQSIIIECQELVTSIQAMVASQRGYLLSGEPIFLDTFEKDKSKVTEEIASLAEKTRDNPSQQSRLVELQQNVAIFIGGLSTVLAEREQQENDKLALFESSEKNADVRENIFRLANSILDEEYAILAARGQALEKKTDQYHLTLLVGGSVAALLLLIFNWFLLQAQSRRNVAERSLREAEERLQLAVKGSNDGIFDWDVAAEKMYWSPQYKRMIGYDDELHASLDVFNKLIHPEDKDGMWQAYEEYVNGSMHEFSHIFRMQHKEGSWVWVHARGKAIYNKDGDVERFIGAHTDVTDIKEYEQRLEEAKEAAEKANQAKGEFLAHMSHEIRTPLTAISGVVEILNNNLEDFDEKKRKLITTLASSASSLKDLITDILDFSKIESGEIELDEDDFVLENLFAQVISITAMRAAEKKLDFHFDYNAVAGLVFYGDKARFRQILINLIGNAIKFTDQGFVHVSAEIVSKEEGNILKIVIKDTGIGIAPEAQTVVFEKFRQADSSVSRRYGGTGLGLPISQNLVKIMGGTIILESALGEGTTFTVSLPMKKDVNILSQGHSRSIQIHKDNDRLSTSLEGKNKVLLVEDYEGNIVVLGHVLEMLGCPYDVARTGVEAVESWKNKHYALILMDVQMPEMDGLAATRTIRALEKDQDMRLTPIIGLTAHALVADKQKCIDSGMNDYLSKPIDEKTLSAIVLKYLKEKQPDDNHQAA